MLFLPEKLRKINIEFNTETLFIIILIIFIYENLKKPLNFINFKSLNLEDVLFGSLSTILSNYYINYTKPFDYYEIFYKFTIPINFFIFTFFMIIYNDLRNKFNQLLFSKKDN